MEITFNKEGKRWVSQFEVSQDFNLHLERKEGGTLYLQQSSVSGGDYDSVRSADFSGGDLIVDYDFTALVYPKYIKVVCATKPTYAEVVSDGEVTEIKSQSKEIEVTANGTTVVEPDAGFAYLNKVSVKTNVEQSVDSGGGYLYVQETDAIGAFAYLGKIGENEIGLPKGIYPTPLLVAFGLDEIVTAFGIPLGVRITDSNTLQDVILTKEYMMSQFPTLQEITEEEFYNLNAL